MFKDPENYVPKHAKEPENSENAWDKLKKLRLNKSQNTYNKILKKSIIDGDPVECNGQKITLTKEMIDEAHLGPKHELEIGGKKIYLSSAFNMNGHRAALAYVPNQKGKTKIRTYYQSNSQGLWRYLPDYVLEHNGTPRYGKADGENSLNLPFGLQKKLSEISTNDAIDVSNPDLFFFGTTYRYTSELMYAIDKKQGTRRGDFYQEVSQLSEPTENSDYAEKKSEPTEKSDHKKEEPEEVGMPQWQQEPNFKDEVDSALLNSPLYGNIDAKVFRSCNSQLLYTMCSIEGRDGTEAWVGSIQVPSHITSTGCYAKWTFRKDIDTPLYEYSAQADGYGDPHDRKAGYVSMWQNYLSKVPIIKRFLHETGKA